jgi:Fe-S-cluster containining protein
LSIKPSAQRAHSPTLNRTAPHQSKTSSQTLRNNADICAKQNTLMRCLRCSVCCTKTEMLLSKQDIKRLENKGYRKKSFARYDKEGYAILRNRQGYCVFYNPKKPQCNIYADRPAGCRVYPVILDEDIGIIIDHICPAKRTITEEEKTRKGKRVLKLLEKIDQEAEHTRSM